MIRRGYDAELDLRAADEIDGLGGDGMNYEMGTNSISIAAFIATLITLGLIDVVMCLSRSVLKIVRKKRGSGLFDPLGETAASQDNQPKRIRGDDSGPRELNNGQPRPQDWNHLAHNAGDDWEPVEVYRRSPSSSPSKPSAGVDDKPRAEVDGAPDDATG